MAAWELGRACFNWGELLKDPVAQEKVYTEGVAACRRSLSLDPKSGSSALLGMNIGRQADLKRNLVALGMVGMWSARFRRPASWMRISVMRADRNLGLLYHEAPAGRSALAMTSWPVNIWSAPPNSPPDYPENRLNLAEAYREWHEKKLFQRELEAIQQLWPSAETNFTGVGGRAIGRIKTAAPSSAAKSAATRRFGFHPAGFPTFRSVQPIAFQLGPVTVHWFGVCIALAFLAGMWTAANAADRSCRRTDCRPRRAVAAHWRHHRRVDDVRRHVLARRIRWQALVGNLRDPARGFHGGLIGRRWRSSSLRWIKSFPSGRPRGTFWAPSIALGSGMFGRIGCSMNGCCFGRACGFAVGDPLS